jgi:hypothetical protein
MEHQLAIPPSSISFIDFINYLEFTNNDNYEFLDVLKSIVLEHCENNLQSLLGTIFEKSIMTESYDDWSQNKLRDKLIHLVGGYSKFNQICQLLMTDGHIIIIKSLSPSGDCSKCPTMTPATLFFHTFCYCCQSSSYNIPAKIQKNYMRQDHPHYGICIRGSNAI